MNEQEQLQLEGVAVIGMAGRFPDANSLAIFWENLCNGHESIKQFSDAELDSAGVAPELRRLPTYVRAKGIIDDIEYFDADFFGVTPRDAAFIDPQHRLFLECVWQALEDAGYVPEQVPGPIGLFAGTSINTYFINQILQNAEFLENMGGFDNILFGTDKDYLTTRVSYKLDLRGPSLDIQTACSTSLVAIQVAYQSLLNYQCDMALAGGVSIKVPQKAGYVYQEGAILSPDGHCRPFDAQAQGTVGGDGLGIVVLKRLEDAVADGDHIYAVIKGAAINNDGALKAGYTAPSVAGQAEVIATAQALAEVDPATITLIEAHGTATPLGDPIEMEALSQAFALKTNQKQFCAIGSVKGNIGHLDAAAGVAGFIKAVLALKHKRIPPSLNFERPNPKIDFENSPFYVNTQPKPWASNGIPRRAGVSSFGIGGTNAHIVLEETPPLPEERSSRPHQLLLLSARSQPALEAATAQLARHLRQHPEQSLADVSHTLQVGRKAFAHRRAVVSHSREDAIAALEAPNPSHSFTAGPTTETRPVIFMFSGQGAQYVNMAAELYQTEPAFRKIVDECANFLTPKLGLDLREVLYPAPAQAEVAAQQLQQTAITQPALFVIEYALAQLWLSWGIRPQAMIGHSIGEYTAACLAGVFSLEDALTLVAERGRLMQSLPGGAMLAVSLAADDIRPLLPDGLSLAAINGPAQCVVSGPTSLIETWHSDLTAKNISCQPLHTSHAFHSAMMEPILPAFKVQVARITLKSPQIPFISNVTGAWITGQQVTDPAYWANHLRHTVHFAAGVNLLLQESSAILLEVGPGRTLAALVKQQLEAPESHPVLASLRHPRDTQADDSFLLTTLGRIWLAGGEVNWSGFCQNENRRRVSLPTYPFERQRYWVEAQSAAVATRSTIKPKGVLQKKTDVADWFYAPSWKRLPLPAPFVQHPLSQKSLCWLIFLDSASVGSALATRLKQAGHEVVTVSSGNQFHQIDTRQFTIRAGEPADYIALLQTLHKSNKIPDRVVHLWSVTSHKNSTGVELLDQIQDLGLYSLLALAKSLGEYNLATGFSIEIVSTNMHEVTGAETLCPEKNTILGPCKVIPLEYPQIKCRNIDIEISDSKDAVDQSLVDLLLAELMTPPSDKIVAYRGLYRWVQSFEPVRLEKSGAISPRLREKGVYLITGGLGGIGLVLAEYLAREVQARLVLIGRSALPSKAKWDEWLATHDPNDQTSYKIKKVQILEALGAEVLVCGADIAIESEARVAIRQAIEKFGAINGVIHAAGVIDQAGIIQRRSRYETETVLAPKVKGTLVLNTLLDNFNLDFFALCSTTGNIFSPVKFGEVGYSAANEYLDAFACYKTGQNGTFTVAINWTDWTEVGMSVRAMARYIQSGHIANSGDMQLGGLSSAEGVEVFDRIIAHSFPRVIVSPQDLTGLVEYIELLFKQRFLDSSKQIEPDSKPAHQRPDLKSSYVSPRNDIERRIINIWETLLGFKQIGIHDNFFELGGDSLYMTQLASRLREIFNETIPLKTLFEAFTVADQAVLIAQHKAMSIEDQTLSELLAEIGSLSAEEIEAALQE